MKIRTLLAGLLVALFCVAPALAQNLELNAARGDGLDAEYRFGFNADIATSEETVWDQGGLYTYPTAAGQLGVSSSSAEDEAAGAGAFTVQIYGLDGDYVETNETVTITSQNSAQTTNSYLRVFRAIIRTAGASEFNVGDVYVGTGTVTSGVPATKYLKITAQQNQSLMALWTVPANKWFYLTRFVASTFGNATQSLTVRLVAMPEDEVFQTKDKVILFRSPVEFNHELPIRFAPKTDIEVRAVASGGTLDASAAFEGYVIGQ